MTRRDELGTVAGFDRAYTARYAPEIRDALRGYFRGQTRGLELLPGGPFVGAGNHSGAALMPDLFLFGAEAQSRWAEREGSASPSPPVHILGHDALFDAYPRAVSEAFTRLGGMRAEHRAAREALDRGHAVVAYPGGDYDANRPFYQADTIVFAGRKGYVRLAREAGVPIVPVVSHGAHRALVMLSDGAFIAERLGLRKKLRLAVFPVALSVPWGLTLGPLVLYLPMRARITQQVLPPVDAREGTVDEVDLRVRTAMQEALDELARERSGE